jgi:hypothetical protein
MRRAHPLVLTTVLMLASAFTAFAQTPPPILQEPQTWPLGSRDVPGAPMAEDNPTITVSCLRIRRGR